MLLMKGPSVIGTCKVTWEVPITHEPVVLESCHLHSYLLITSQQDAHGTVPDHLETAVYFVVSLTPLPSGRNLRDSTDVDSKGLLRSAISCCLFQCLFVISPDGHDF